MPSRRPLPPAVPLSLCLLLASPALAAEPSVDLSGTYTTAAGETFSILESKKGLVFWFDAVFGPSAHTCDCLVEAKEQGPGRYTFTNELGGLRVENGRVVVELSRPSCCGAGFGGFRPAALAQRSIPEQCTVKGARAFFRALDGRPARAYVVKGDKVEALPAGTFLEGFVVARFFSGKRKTLGLLKREELVCPGDAGPSPSTATAEAHE
jgi:hypothetical protein